MANLGTFEIACNGEYKDIAQETGVTFSNGNIYYIQYYNKGFFREGDLGKGFVICQADPIGIEYKGDTLYVCSSGTIEINIAE